MTTQWSKRRKNKPQSKTIDKAISKRNLRQATVLDSTQIETHPLR